MGQSSLVATSESAMHSVENLKPGDTVIKGHSGSTILGLVKGDVIICGLISYGFEDVVT